MRKMGCLWGCKDLSIIAKVGMMEETAPPSGLYCSESGVVNGKEGKKWKRWKGFRRESRG